ncbi:MAG: hypothetical protein SNJ82_11530 [Gemmataceae bacterium]
MKFVQSVSLALLTAWLTLGCGPNVKQESVSVIGIDPMNLVKATLQNYANGQPMTSEASGFDSMVEEVRKVYPDKADILQKGLEELKTAKGPALVSKSKELMKKLGIEVTEKAKK